MAVSIYDNKDSYNYGRFSLKFQLSYNQRYSIVSLAVFVARIVRKVKNCVLNTDHVLLFSSVDCVTPNGLNVVKYVYVYSFLCNSSKFIFPGIFQRLISLLLYNSERTHNIIVIIIIAFKSTKAISIIS